METFSALLAFCVGNSPVTGEFPSQRLVTRSFDVFFDLCLNKRLSKESWGWLFETPWRSLWPQCNAAILFRCRVTHCGMVTPFGNGGSGKWSVVNGTKPLHEPHFYFSSVRFCYIHMGAVSHRYLGYYNVKWVRNAFFWNNLHISQGPTK